MNKQPNIKKAVEWAINIAKDNTHGYDQEHRLGPDYDCSSFVAAALIQGDFTVSPASWTGNLYNQLTANNFKSCKAPWKAGDIHLKPGKHVCMSVNDKEIVHARINEKGTITGGQPGDQTGNEIAITPYYDNNWTYHLRYTSPKYNDNDQMWAIAEDVIAGKYGNYPARKEALQSAGYEYLDIQNRVNAICIAKDVIKGKYGNGEERMKRLMEKGFDYCLVQEYVNKMLGVIKD